MARTLTLLVLVLAALPVTAMAKNEACAGVSKKCTTDKTYDKTIDGEKYSCYDCTQTLCKDGGDTISGTATSSVCTEKASTFQPISTEDQFAGGDTMAPKPASRKQPGRATDPRTDMGTAAARVSPREARLLKFDEADTLFGKRTGLQSASPESGSASSPVKRDHRPAGSAKKVTIVLPSDLFPLPTKNKKLRDHRVGRTVTTRDHRDRSDRPDTIGVIVDGTSNTLSAQHLQAPSDVTVPTVSRTTLTISWRDNSTEEYGVELYRAHPLELRRDPESAWQFIGLFQARIADRVTGTGLRMDEDYDLSPGTTYCYRMRAYIGFDRAQASDFSGVTCATTSL